MENVKKYYNELEKLIKKHITPVVLVLALIILWLLVGKNVYNHFMINGEWELEDTTLIIENNNCESEYTYDGDTESEDFDCEIKWGTVYVDDKYQDGYYEIKNGKLYYSYGGYEKK